MRMLHILVVGQSQPMTKGFHLLLLDLTILSLDPVIAKFRQTESTCIILLFHYTRVSAFVCLANFRQS